MPLCGHALLVTVQGANGFLLRLREPEGMLTLPAAEMVVEMMGGHAGSPILMVRPGASAEALAAQMLAVSPANDHSVRTVSGTPR